MTWAALATLVLLQAAAGAVVWAWVSRRSISSIELVGMGLAVGTALSALGGCAGFLLPVGSGARAWAWAVPAVVVLSVWIIARARGVRGQGITLGSGAEWAGVVVAGTAGLLTIAGNARALPLDWTGTQPIHQDMVFFEALAQGTSRFAPTDSVFMAGADIRYHWLAYAWSGQLTNAVAAEPFTILTRVLPVVALAGTVLLVVAWAHRLSRVSWVPTLAGLLVVTGGFVGALYGAILNVDSPSQSLAMLWMLGLVVAFLDALTSRHPWPLAAVILLLACATSGGKVSAIAAALCGMAAVSLVAVVRRESWWRRAVGLTALATLAMAVMFALLVTGSAQSGGLGVWSLLDRASSVQGLNPQLTDRGIIAGTALLILAIGFRWAGALWLLVVPARRRLPDTALGVGMAIVGIATITLLSGGFNDMWFALVASAPLSVLAAVGAGDAVAAIDRRASVSAAAIGLGGSLAVASVWGTGAYSAGGWRWAAPLLGVLVALLAAGAAAALTRASAPFGRAALAGFLIACAALAVLSRPTYLVAQQVMQPPAAPHDLAEFAPVRSFTDAIDRVSLETISADEREAGALVARMANPQDIVATNVTYSPLVAALTGLRTYASGIHYQAPYGRPGAVDPLLDRERLSWEFIDAPTDAGARVLCEAGVRWLWIDPRRTQNRSWTMWGEVVDTRPDVLLLRLTACA